MVQRRGDRADAPHAGGDAGYVLSSVTGRQRRCRLARSALRVRCCEAGGVVAAEKKDASAATAAAGARCQRSDVGRARGEQAPGEMKNGQQHMPR